MRHPLTALGMIMLALSLGCRRDMFDQARTKPLRPSPFFSDGASARPLPPHTVPRGEWRDALYLTGQAGTNLAEAIPLPVTAELLRRGRERFEIYCAGCHGRTGTGGGMIVQRGFPAPPSYHSERLRAAPIGHFFDVMTRGYGVMYPQASRVAPGDRWAIAAYIRALQLRARASIEDVPPAERAILEASR